MVGLLTTLLSLFILEVGGVGLILLVLTCTPIPIAVSFMAVGPAALASTVAPVPAVVVSFYFVSVMLSPVRVGTPTSSTALMLPSLGIGLVARPAVI